MFFKEVLMWMETARTKATRMETARMETARMETMEVMVE